MRLATLDLSDSTQVAAQLPDGTYALIADADGLPVGDLARLIRLPGWRQLAERAVAEGDRKDSNTPLAAPLEPTAVICVGVNYRAHIREMNDVVPDYPTLFSKLPRAIVGPDVDVALPSSAADAVDYEGEFALVIGQGGRNIAPEDAWSAVAGVTLANDVSMRDFQMRTPQWFAGKTWQRSTPVGPVVVTTDELGDFDDRELRVTVNGELRQHARVGDLVFDVPSLIAYISTIIELQPGDVILSGTPGGVGFARDPQAFLRDGDLVEVSLDGIGTLRNFFRADSESMNGTAHQLTVETSQ